MTQKEMFVRIAEVMVDEPEIVEFCEKQIAKLSKPRTPKANPEVAEFRAAVATWLAENGPAVNKDVAEAFEVSSQKSAPALNFLVSEGVATAEMTGKVKIYAVA